MEIVDGRKGVCFPGLAVRIYRVAELHPDSTHSLIAPFDGYPVQIHDIRFQKQWREAANTLAAYAAADGISPDHAAVTDDAGTAVFTDLKTGLYLVEGLTVKDDSGTYRFENFMIFLPTPQPDGSLCYDMEAKPKAAFTPEPEDPYTQYQVVKLWKDGALSGQRPASVTVEILKHGVTQETVTLHAGNNWCYEWTAPAEDDVWTVVERDVPEGYSVAMTAAGGIFTITNSRDTPGGTPPQTGDVLQLRQYILAACVSGTLLEAAWDLTLFVQDPVSRGYILVRCDQ